jgi:hypothetical protein
VVFVLCLAHSIHLVGASRLRQAELSGHVVMQPECCCQHHCVEMCLLEGIKLELLQQLQHQQSQQQSGVSCIRTIRLRRWLGYLSDLTMPASMLCSTWVVF